MVLKEVKNIFNEIMGLSDEEITLESHIYDDLDADSLDMSQIFLGLENKYDISIDEEDSIETINDLVAYIENRI
ncbi:MAG: acyl carrier protein [Firmicutes bacterium]|jgi:acyl carrier protein|nr:acyl carrier protein [Bacillota bacterium]